MKKCANADCTNEIPDDRKFCCRPCANQHNSKDRPKYKPHRSSFSGRRTTSGIARYSGHEAI